LFTSQDIAAYYEQSHTHYVQHWQLNRYQAMHYGLWWPDTRDFGEALMNTHRLMVAWGRVQAADQVLDAGCGVGGSGLWLAREVGCQVIGLTLSARQATRGQALAKAQGLAGQVHIRQGDFTQTGLPAESVDVVWAIESVCHAPDKGAFLAEAYRLLRPGGRLVLCDFFRHEATPTAYGAKVYRQWLDSWAIDQLSTQPGLVAAAQRVGFTDLRSQDLTAEITPSARRLYRRFRLGFPVQKLYEWLGNPTAVQRSSVRSARWQWQALQAGSWHYAIMGAQKVDH
jgi:cyclopropane fatty-acyl-phospholipid synthase-like methyltransferase